MKTIKLIKSGEGKDEVDGKNILTGILKNMQRGGDLEQMRRRIDVLAKLEKSDGSIDLEDAQFAVVSEAVRGFTFNFATPELLAVCDALVTPVSVDKPVND